MDEMAQLDRMNADFIAFALHESCASLGLITRSRYLLVRVITEEHVFLLDISVRNTTRLKKIVDNMANIDNVQHSMVNDCHRPVSIERVTREMMDSFLDKAHQKCMTLGMEAKPENPLTGSGQNILLGGYASKFAIALH